MTELGWKVTMKSAPDSNIVKRGFVDYNIFFFARTICRKYDK